MNTAAAPAASPGETDLQRLLAGLSPQLSPLPRTISAQARGAPVPAGAIMLFREDEATTVIAETGPDARAGTAGAEPLWAQITLRVHSSLDAVGMMAAVAAALAARDIPCNAVSACFHDHLFVPWAKREDALAAIEALSHAHREFGA